MQGRYRLSDVLGEGGQARTYRAKDLRSGHDVALKRLDMKTADNWKCIELFEREGAVLKTLDHPSIPRYLETFTEESDQGTTFYLVQELVEGETLESIGQKQRFDARSAGDVAVQILDILIYLHGRSPPVIHRDIKPRDILRRTDGRLALVDFGAAQMLAPIATNGGSTIVGTYGYMAPEQFAGRAFPASDLYALGATLVFLLSGRHPSEMELERMRLQFEAHVNVDRGFERYLSLLLEPHLEDRIDTAQGARDMLALVRNGYWRHARRPKSDKERVIEPVDERSWLRLRTTDDTISAEIPPFHNAFSRLQASSSAIGLGLCLLIGTLFPTFAWLLLPVLPLLAYALLDPFFGARLKVDRKRFVLYREFLGIPWKIRRGDSKNLVVQEARDAAGKLSGGISAWSGFDEHHLTGGLNKEERAWILSEMGDELLRVRGPVREGDAVRIAGEAVALPVPRSRRLLTRVNLLPARGCR